MDLGVDASLVKAIAALHTDNIARVRYGTDGECTDRFQVQKDVRQGCVPAPLLFSLLRNNVVHYLLVDQLDVPIVAGRRVPILLFVVDAVLVARTENTAHGLLGRFVKYGEEKSLTINCMKTMGITLRPSPSLRWKLVINHVPIEVTKHFDYLGVQF
ncbi:hypothetical protein NDU88_012625 [Pleurodeles waltl]|uniref:Reverse transcriptase domain-containing protein n=1 Tax=Pleurodeles waltl TaxID=8319 RepID=A0AAV7R1Z6_PLEWA|nr:hypothetical protein NDU88_012625 [Pleurodeles waltl]